MTTATKPKATPTRAKPINSRAKGASAEREFAKLVMDHLGVELRRNLEQSRADGHDLVVVGDDPVSIALDGWAIECKRYALVTPGLIRQWWAQATEQAVRAGKVPALAYRQDRQEWGVIVPLWAINGDAFGRWSGIEWTAAVSVPAFCALVREATR